MHRRRRLLAGCLGMQQFRKIEDEVAEFTTMSYWSSMEAMEAATIGALRTWRKTPTTCSSSPSPSRSASYTSTTGTCGTVLIIEDEYPVDYRLPATRPATDEKAVPSTLSSRGSSSTLSSTRRRALRMS
jgi:hypothetical protein